jgi:adenylosuccinate lyase
MIGRYQTDAMRNIWNEEATFERWTRVEVAASEAFFARGEVPADEMQTIRDKAHHQSAERVREIEKTTNHDVVAFVRAVGEVVGEPAARHLHRGLTSSDVVDTALAMAVRDSLTVVIDATITLRSAVAKRAIEHKFTPCVGRTHGIHAEPTTFGLRLAGWYTELTRNIERLTQARADIRFGKLSGAVGTFSQTDPQFESFVLNLLDLDAEPIATQVVPRDRHASVMCAIAVLGASIERFATEIRALQRTDIRELEEPFTAGQTGSSAMPHKRNPITSERLTGMARLLRGYAVSALEDVALWHDRDISHSSVERVIFPDAFHLAHYMLQKLTHLVAHMRVYPQNMLDNLHKTQGLVFSQNVLGALLSKGHDRTLAYKAVQRCAMQVWEGEAKDFKSALKSDTWVQDALSAKELDQAFDLAGYSKHIDALFVRAGIQE